MPRLIILVIALHAEAAAIISHFQLKKNHVHRAFDVYENSEIFLILSGVGGISSAIATTYAILHVSQSNPLSCSSAVNFGSCGLFLGSNPDDSPSNPNKIGQIFVINKVTDTSSLRDVYPERLISFDLPENALNTSPKPVDSAYLKSFKPFGSFESSALFDMEGFSFFEAARKFLPLHQIYLFKIATDLLAPENVSPEAVTQHVVQNIPTLASCFRRIRESAQSLSSGFLELPPHLQQLLDALCQKWKFTFTQRHQIYDCAKYFELQHNESDQLQPMLMELLQVNPLSQNSKQERNMIFEQLKQKLLT